MWEALVMLISWNGERGGVSTLDISFWSSTDCRARRAVHLRGISVEVVAAVIMTAIVEGSG
jgi:hypothetical protein